MKNKILCIIIFLLLISTTSFGQSSFQGIIILLDVCCTITIGTHNTYALPGLIPQAPPRASAITATFSSDGFTLSIQAPQSDRRAGVDARDEFDRTPLMRAAASGDLVAAKELLARGADVNAKTADDYTILMYAASYGNAEIVEFLLDNGADVNARHKQGLTALIEAAKQYMDAGDVIANYIGTVEALLKKGADVSVRDKDGSTALVYAEKYGLRNKHEIVRLLRNAGAK